MSKAIASPGIVSVLRFKHARVEGIPRDAATHRLQGGGTLEAGQRGQPLENDDRQKEDMIAAH